MKNEIQLGLVFLLSILISACATDQLKAPCDYHARYCGSKTKINQW